MAKKEKLTVENFQALHERVSEIQLDLVDLANAARSNAGLPKLEREAVINMMRTLMCVARESADAALLMQSHVGSLDREAEIRRLQALPPSLRKGG